MTNLVDYDNSVKTDDVVIGYKEFVFLFKKNTSARENSIIEIKPDLVNPETSRKWTEIRRSRETQNLKMRNWLYLHKKKMVEIMHFFADSNQHVLYFLPRSRYIIKIIVNFVKCTF
jgi:hypothetical protein